MNQTCAKADKEKDSRRSSNHSTVSIQGVRLLKTKSFSSPETGIFSPLFAVSYKQWKLLLPLHVLKKRKEKSLQPLEPTVTSEPQPPILRRNSLTELLPCISRFCKYVVWNAASSKPFLQPLMLRQLSSVPNSIRFSFLGGQRALPGVLDIQQLVVFFFFCCYQSSSDDRLGGMKENRKS